MLHCYNICTIWSPHTTIQTQISTKPPTFCTHFYDMAETDAFPYEVNRNCARVIWFYCSLSVFGLDRKTCSLAHPHKKKWHEVRSGLGWGQFVFPPRPIHRSEKTAVNQDQDNLSNWTLCWLFDHNVHFRSHWYFYSLSKCSKTLIYFFFQSLSSRDRKRNFFSHFTFNSYFPQF